MKTCPRCLKNLGFDSAHACIPASYVQDMEAEVEELHSQLDFLGARLAGAEATANGFRIERDALKAKLDEAESHRINLSASQKEAQARNTGLYAENAALTARVEALEGLLHESMVTHNMWRDVAPAISLVQDIKAALNSTPAADLQAHDEAVRREVVKKSLDASNAWLDDDGNYLSDKAFYHAAGIPPSTEAPIQEKK